MKVKFQCPKTGIPDCLLVDVIREINVISAEHGLHVGTVAMTVGLRDEDGYAQNIPGPQIPDPDWKDGTIEGEIGYLIRSTPYKSQPKDKQLVKVFSDENGEVTGYMYQTVTVPKWRF